MPSLPGASSSSGSSGAAQQPSQPSEAHHRPERGDERRDESFYSGNISKPVAATSSDTG